MFDITPSDTEDLPYATRVIYASADCVLNVTLTGGETQQLTVFRGYNPLPVVKVWATDTVVGTASVKGCY